jgi:hypothetical protein
MKDPHIILMVLLAPPLLHGPARREKQYREEEVMEKTERLDVLVKGIPVKTHNIFKGICAMHDKTVNEGIIDAMMDYIERFSTVEVSPRQTAERR